MIVPGGSRMVDALVVLAVFCTQGVSVVLAVQVSLEFVEVRPRASITVPPTKVPALMMLNSVVQISMVVLANGVASRNVADMPVVHPVPVEFVQLALLPSAAKARVGETYAAMQATASARQRIVFMCFMIFSPRVSSIESWLLSANA